MKVLVLLDVLSDVSGKQCNREKHSEDKGDVSKTRQKQKHIIGPHFFSWIYEKEREL